MDNTVDSVKRARLERKNAALRLKRLMNGGGTGVRFLGDFSNKDIKEKPSVAKPPFSITKQCSLKQKQTVKQTHQMFILREDQSKEQSFSELPEQGLYIFIQCSNFLWIL